jgi:hypothetical protein
VKFKLSSKEKQLLNSKQIFIKSPNNNKKYEIIGQKQKVLYSIIIKTIILFLIINKKINTNNIKNF